MKLNLKIILTLILISVILAASGYAILLQLDKLTPISNQLPESMKDLAEKSSMDGYAQLVRYYDEILTQSARNYAFTQDKKWEERYREAEPKLIAIIDKAIDAGDDLEKDFFSRVDEANMALVEMEYAALDLVNAGKASEAIDILESQEYWDYKNFYLDGLNDYVSNREMQYEQAKEASTIELDDISRTTQIIITDSRNTFLFSIPLVLITLFVTAIILNRTVINPIKKLKDATVSIGSGNLDINVVTKGNDEIHDLSKSFSEMSKYLKKYQDETIKRTLAEEHGLELEKIEKSKDEFVAMVSHELKNPLTPIKMYSAALKRPKILGELNKKQAEAVDGIIFNALRLERMIGDLLDVQKLELGKIKFENKWVVVEEFMGMVTRNLKTETEKKGCQLINHTKGEIIMKSDTPRLAQVFSNLINNSIDFIPKNKGKIEINAQNEKDEVLFSVKDNGVGMTLETQTGLFQKFYQADTSIRRKHGGTGLGLAICKGIVEGLGGKIWLESEVGKGTTFFFTIPRGTLNENIDNR